MIPAAGIQDQELPVGTERPGIDHPAVARRGDLGAGTGGDRQTAFGAPKPVRWPQIPGLRTPLAGKGSFPLSGSEGDRRGQAAGVLERGHIRPVVGRLAILAGARRRAGGAGAGFEVRFELGDQLSEIGRLAGQLRRPDPLVWLSAFSASACRFRRSSISSDRRWRSSACRSPAASSACSRWTWRRPCAPRVGQQGLVAVDLDAVSRAVRRDSLGGSRHASARAWPQRPDRRRGGADPGGALGRDRPAQHARRTVRQ